MTAEQKWKDWANERVTPQNPVVTGSIVFGIKAYKSALRKAIELKIETLKTIQARTKDYQSVFDGPIAAYEGVLETMNTVEPE